ncbi:hypothetical protein Bbelb_063480 [Branchiostoma belcheri]|nr:hypothetical protein Bbelb_063480 [Branchiostoma belcheri]
MDSGCYSIGPSTSCDTAQSGGSLSKEEPENDGKEEQQDNIAVKDSEAVVTEQPSPPQPACEGAANNVQEAARSIQPERNAVDTATVLKVLQETCQEMFEDMENLQSFAEMMADSTSSESLPNIKKGPPDSKNTKAVQTNPPASTTSTSNSILMPSPSEDQDSSAAVEEQREEKKDEKKPGMLKDDVSESIDLEPKNTPDHSTDNVQEEPKAIGKETLSLHNQKDLDQMQQHSESPRQKEELKSSVKPMEEELGDSASNCGPSDSCKKNKQPSVGQRQEDMPTEDQDRKKQGDKMMMSHKKEKKTESEDEKEDRVLPNKLLSNGHASEEKKSPRATANNLEKKAKPEEPVKNVVVPSPRKKDQGKDKSKSEVASNNEGQPKKVPTNSQMKSGRSAKQINSVLSKNPVKGNPPEDKDKTGIPSNNHVKRGQSEEPKSVDLLKEPLKQDPLEVKDKRPQSERPKSGDLPKKLKEDPSKVKDKTGVAEKNGVQTILPNNPRKKSHQDKDKADHEVLSNTPVKRPQSKEPKSGDLLREPPKEDPSEVKDKTGVQAVLPNNPRKEVHQDKAEVQSNTKVKGGQSEDPEKSQDLSNNRATKEGHQGKDNTPPVLSNIQVNRPQPEEEEKSGVLLLNKPRKLKEYELIAQTPGNTSSHEEGDKILLEEDIETLKKVKNWMNLKIPSLLALLSFLFDLLRTWSHKEEPPDVTSNHKTNTATMTVPVDQDALIYNVQRQDEEVLGDSSDEDDDEEQDGYHQPVWLAQLADDSVEDEEDLYLGSEDTIAFPEPGAAEPGAAAGPMFCSEVPENGQIAVGGGVSISPFNNPSQIGDHVHPSHHFPTASAQGLQNASDMSLEEAVQRYRRTERGMTVTVLGLGEQVVSQTRVYDPTTLQEHILEHTAEQAFAKYPMDGFTVKLPGGRTVPLEMPLDPWSWTFQNITFQLHPANHGDSTWLWRVTHSENPGGGKYSVEVNIHSVGRGVTRVPDDPDDRGSGLDCCICQDTQPGGTLVETSCGHKFHEVCLFKWLQSVELNTERRIQAFETKSLRRLLGISYHQHKTNEYVYQQVYSLVGPQEAVMSTVRRRKLQWFGHLTRHNNLAKTILQGTLEGKRRRGRQKKVRRDNIKNWTSLTVPQLLTAAQDRRSWLHSCCKVYLVPPTTSVGHGTSKMEMLRANHRLLKNTIRVCHVTGNLYRNGTLSRSDLQRINSKSTEEERTEVLLLILSGKGGRAYRAFLRALKVRHGGRRLYDDVVKLLEGTADQGAQSAGDVHVWSTLDREVIANSLDPVEACKHLVKSCFLTEEESDAVKDEETVFEKAHTLLRVLGTGKRQISRWVASEILPLHPDAVIWRLDGGSRSRFLASKKELLRALGSQVPDEDSRVDECLDETLEWRGTPVLLIVHNLTDGSLLTPTFLKERPQSSVMLLIHRDPEDLLLPEEAPIPCTVQLEGFQTGEGIRFLQADLTKPDIPIDELQCLTDIFDGCPLGISAARQYMKDTHISPEQYLLLLKDENTAMFLQQEAQRLVY